MHDLLRGAGYLLEGFRLLARPRIRRLAAAPILLTAALLGGAVFYGGRWFTALVELVEGAVPDGFAWLGVVLWVLFAVAAGAVLLLLFATVAATVSSPFNGPLAAAVEQLATGKPPPAAGLRDSLRSLPGMLVQEVKKVLYALLWTLAALLAFVVPGVNLVAPLLWLLCCAWLTAFAFADYALANHGLTLAQSRRMLRRRWWLSIGFGGAAYLAFLVPLVNLLAVPAAVCGGALLSVRELRGAAGELAR